MGFTAGYENAPNWTLVNRWTIHEDKHLPDRPFMRTCVPKRLFIDLHDIALNFGAAWEGEQESLFDPPVNPRHRQVLRIEAVGILNNARIHVFRMSEGVIDSYETLRRVVIHSIEPGCLGGKDNATPMDGIGFSGMSSTDVPEGGLMNGEPGCLMWIDDRKNRDVALHERRVGLTLEVYLERRAFSRLAFQLISAGERIECGEMCLIAELFEDEVQASLKDTWMDSDYGFLITDEKYVNSYRARLDGIHFATAKFAPMPKHDDDEHWESPPVANSPPEDRISKIDRGGRKLAGWPSLVIGGLIGAIVSLLFF